MKARALALSIALFSVVHFLVGNRRPCLASTSSGGGPLTDRDQCHQLLDGFDAKFDHARDARRNVTNDVAHITYLASNPKFFFDSFEPEAVCFTEERFGSFRSERDAAFGDGPKFTCGVDLVAQKQKGKAKGDKEGCLVYSVGSWNDVLFERTVHEFMGCEIHTFDPTLGKPFVGDKYSKFHPWGLGEDGVPGSFGKHSWVGKSLHTIMKELGHANRTLDILKIDCEQCEYKTMPPFFKSIARGEVKMDQLLVEMHANPIYGPIHPREVVNFFNAADGAGLRIVHKERNHWGCDGYKCVEYALVSESFLREANGAAVCRGGRPM